MHKYKSVIIQLENVAKEPLTVYGVYGITFRHILSSQNSDLRSCVRWRRYKLRSYAIFLSFFLLYSGISFFTQILKAPRADFLAGRRIYTYGRLRRDS